MRKSNTKATLSTFVLLGTLLFTQQPSFAGFGNLFSGANSGTDSLPNGATSPLTPPGAIGTVDGDDGTARHGDKPKTTSAGPTGTDYTEDERRMQGRYTGDIGNAKKKLAEAERMMKSNNPKVARKGAIMKEIEEKELGRLKEANPFPAQHSLEDSHRGSKPDSL
jgi:hypothetical protein